jgi:hypothetical protein
MQVEMTRSRPPAWSPRPDQMNPSDLTNRVPGKTGAIRCGLMLGSPPARHEAISKGRSNAGRARRPAMVASASLDLKMAP